MAVKIVFMGTPAYAVPALTQLHQHYSVVGVFTQPDKPSGRGRQVSVSAVKEAAQALGLPVYQPPNLKTADALALLQSLAPDLIVVAAFGQILRANVLSLPPLGCLNLHASLLPRWRGAAPVAAAIRAGDAQTGVTIMQMDEGLDTGAIIRAEAIPVLPTHTCATLTADLADLGADLLVRTLPDWLNRQIIPQPQDETLVTLAPRLKKEAGQIDWTHSAAEIERHIRAFNPWPGAFTVWQGQTIKIHSAEVVAPGGPVAPGTVFSHGRDVAVSAGQGAVILRDIQPAGKKMMPARDFVRGATGFIGSQL